MTKFAWRGGQHCILPLARHELDSPCWHFAYLCSVHAKTSGSHAHPGIIILATTYPLPQTKNKLQKHPCTVLFVLISWSLSFRLFFLFASWPLGLLVFGPLVLRSLGLLKSLLSLLPRVFFLCLIALAGHFWPHCSSIRGFTAYRLPGLWRPHPGSALLTCAHPIGCFSPSNTAPHGSTSRVRCGWGCLVGDNSERNPPVVGECGKPRAPRSSLIYYF